MRYFEHVNMGIATDTPRGLLVPTLFGADTMSLSEIAEKLEELTGVEVAVVSVGPDREQTIIRKQIF